MKYVYMFSEGNSSMKELLGGKGANLAEMTVLGLPVPEGFTVTTEACLRYYEDNKEIAPAIKYEVRDYIKKLEEVTGKKLGDKTNPLLISVRSGARASMPGMMDTILNLGMNDEVVEGLESLTNNRRFAYDSYRRFIQMYSDVVMELPKAEFEAMIEEIKENRGITEDNDLTADDMVEMANKFKAFYKEQVGKDFPQDPFVQLFASIEAVFRSWNNPRALYYRRMNEIPNNWGTAVNIQRMVFGNMGENCATGVCFTRNPATGDKHIFGEFLFNAQGEDVVAGIRTPYNIGELKPVMPEAYQEFEEICHRLEQHYKDMQDVEFTIENGKLYMLQTRSGKRTSNASLKIAVDLVNEGLIDKKQALMQIDARILDSMLHPQFSEETLKDAKEIGQGLAASPGAAGGQAVFTADEAVRYHEQGKKVILVRLETSPEDIEGMHIAQGILTARGGMTSHAAVVARGMGTCCVAGCSEVVFLDETSFRLGGKVYHEGDEISLDGSTGKIYDGLIPTVPAQISGDFETIMKWADEYRTLSIRTNADSPADTRQAIEFGAEGIGLIRTEHMFFEADRIKAMREMILSDTVEERKLALDKLLPMQRGDFEAIFETLEGRPSTVRYLDPPLHEFLPTKDKDIIALAEEMNVTETTLRERITSLHEFNPMMGHRGCRLDVTYPEIAVMQTKAIIEAAINVNKKQSDYTVKVEIMIPLVGELEELKFVKRYVVETADRIIKENNTHLDYIVGTMIELPRACVTADHLASEAEFFSFGTNDLTQMVFGFSRDDASKFLPAYYDNKIFEQDPFVRFDQTGVGPLVQMAIDKAKSVKPNMKLGICGEHGGDPSSIEFFHKAGLSYVSCSPYRVPIARLSAAQAAIKFG